MVTALEDVKETQFITNQAGERTAIIIPVSQDDSDFRKLLTQFLENRDYKTAGQIVAAEHAFREIESYLEVINDRKFLAGIKNEIENMMDLLEDKLDLLEIEARRDEPSISHAELTEELKRNGTL